MESSSVEGIKEEMENGGPRSSSVTETGREVSGGVPQEGQREEDSHGLPHHP